MWAVLDANSYFCSVEKVFHPGLNGKPVCVLSSNDGNIVALTPEAKALGLKRGDPYFKVRDIIERNKVSIFSGNLMLYSAMSKRMVSIIRNNLSNCIQYSIDESFADLNGYGKMNMENLLRHVAEEIRLYTDIPVSVGVAPSKTLAKIGSRFAKKYSGYKSVCLIDTDEKRRKALALTELSDVWGIGRRTCSRLMSLGISSPLQLADKDFGWINRNLTKPGLQTWMELNGKSCIDICDDRFRQSITTSRSFGQMITGIDQLKASVASFAASCASTLRGQRSLAGSIAVFVSSNPFREDLAQYSNMSVRMFDTPTADTIEITAAALEIVNELFRPGIFYKKSGVILENISNGAYQQSLFDTIQNRSERLSLSRTVDSLNHRFGVKSVRLAVEGDKTEQWRVKSEHRSPNYLTDLNEILTVNC